MWFQKYQGLFRKKAGVELPGTANPSCLKKGIYSETSGTFLKKSQRGESFAVYALSRSRCVLISCKHEETLRRMSLFCGGVWHFVDHSHSSSICTTGL